ncbi:MAG: PCP reductase family protein [Nitrospirae bacterium]|nr:PCP reductase family protein [Nitrospirota bacterium]
MLICGCGRWMHTQGVDEREEAGRGPIWLVRSECLACGLSIGFEAPPEEAAVLVDRLMWTDDARHLLERMPPYVEPLVRREVEEYARSKGQRVITCAVLTQARHGGMVAWDPEAERRLENVPAPVRAMARLELERTAAERGQSRVTVALMEEVKARYFGFAGRQ